MSLRALAALLLALGLWLPARAQLQVSTTAGPDRVALQGADVWHAVDADPLEMFVAQDLALDLRRLGLRAGAGPLGLAAGTGLQIWVGTAGRHPAIDALAASGKLDLKPLAGCWECFTLAVVRQPAPGVAAALVIAGADRRGTAYGVYTLSQALGVSPWHWWADVAPLKRGLLYLSLPKPWTEGPAVRYRGLFINDEDWGLFPWASQTFEPEAGAIGPRSYEQVFKLLLRLKANTLWPAMHQVSGAFNARPENAALASRYGIVMGSSHAEPLLRNNVAEWRDKPERYDYAANPEGVRAYWRERLQANGRYENLYTLGMRGIHDSAMQGASSVAAKQALLSRLIADQRELLAREVGNPARLPQIFVPYKEVLALMREPPGLSIPEDVTLVWPDDNFGYIRQLPDAEQQRRSGGSGVYYHLSYLGAPLSYLWLSTTPPALVAAEMLRAFDAGAERVWIVNAGDIKPAEINLSHWFDLAWNPRGVAALSQQDYLRGLAARLFGPAASEPVAQLWDGYYRLNFGRRPEHLQYHLAGERQRRSGLSAAAIDERLQRFRQLLISLDHLRPKMAPQQAAAFFQLVEYPLRASALANERFFALERYATTLERDPAAARLLAAQAVRADRRLKALTARYNQGRWAGILAEEPADGLWTSFRLQAPLLPAPGLGGRSDDALKDLRRAAADLAPVTSERTAPAGLFSSLRVSDERGWQRLAGLGRGEGVLMAREAGATLRLAADPGFAGAACLRVHLLPSYPSDRATAWQAELLRDDEEAVLALRWPRGEQDAAWAQGVLSNRLTIMLTLKVRASEKLRLRTAQAGLMFDGAELQAGTCSP
ncbi:glycosyl hydrolase 115 family protein [Pelomonas sp. V22]|uniref:glycosyl hydrolase 115 family protein n=1 Tax=Pelomonas sp. V22 TaxID=2822139 RepID=UPI0024A8A234|nr:glycosyl hydrolase 115 family protein [Pelomonas sp. V22]MDI4632188.1 glycosyl hydrolase 115 family protein [Pelomonas sp. V22]